MKYLLLGMEMKILNICVKLDNKMKMINNQQLMIELLIPSTFILKMITVI